MPAREAYIGSEQGLNLEVREAGVQEMQDVLSRYRPAFYRKAYGFLGNAADAEDAVQDAILSAYKNLDQFKGEAQLSTWLTSIVINCARMRLRKRLRQNVASLDERLEGEDQDYSLSERLADSRPGPEDNYRESELHRHVMHFVAELSPVLRKAFELRDLEDLTTSEAAKILGVPEGTVKARVARARTRLRWMMRRALHRQPAPTSISLVPSAVEKKQSNGRAALAA